MRQRARVARCIGEPQLVLDAPAVEPPPRFPRPGELRAAVDARREAVDPRLGHDVPLPDQELELRCLARRRGLERPRLVAVLRSGGHCERCDCDRDQKRTVGHDASPVDVATVDLAADVAPTGRVFAERFLEPAERRAKTSSAPPPRRMVAP